MRLRTTQVAAGMLALSAADVGVWAQFAPRSFYSSFPGLGHRWIPPLGPYNEHLIRDVGGLYLAMLVISVWAAFRPRPETLRATGLAWAAFSIPHLVFHLSHLGMYSTVDKVGNAVALVGVLVLALVLVLASSVTEPTAETVTSAL